jgi:SAM-dependent methyltransferase
VASAVAELVGPEGEVVGLDIDPRMLEVARARTEGLPNVRYVEGDVTRWREAEPFDVVVGRLILFHVPDPVGVLRHHQQAVRPGGGVVILDYDIGGLRAEPRDALTDRMGALIMAAFRAVGADPTIGSRLQRILVDAGVVDVEGFAIAEYLASDDPVGPAMLSGVVRSLLPVMVAHGLATEAEVDLDTLATRAAASLQSTGSVLVPPLLAGAWGRHP